MPNGVKQWIRRKEVEKGGETMKQEISPNFAAEADSGEPSLQELRYRFT